MKHILALTSIVSLFGCNQIKELSWEGTGNRIVNKRLYVKVESINKLNRTSPSIAGYMPKPVKLVIKIVAGDKFRPGQKLALKISSYNLDDIKVGSKIAVGLVTDTTFICVEKSSKESWKSACTTPLKLKILFVQ